MLLLCAIDISPCLMPMLFRTARLLLCQESKDDDAVAVKPLYGF